jgi:folate-binding protein YgfZ
MSKLQSSSRDSDLVPTAIRVEGPDALDFLQAQLTLDLRMLAPGRLQATAWCNANGRVAIVALIAVADAGYVLVVPSGMAAETSRRIRLYRIGRKIEVETGLEIDHCAPDATGALLLTHSPQRALRLRLRPDHRAGATEVVPDSQLADDIRHGLPWIVAATSDRFLPQMLGLDDLGGLSYRKGCYPGQEVIARVHFRGRVTRRMLSFRCTGPGSIEPGLEFGGDSQRATVLYSVTQQSGQTLGLAVVPADVDPEQLPKLDATAFEWLDKASA